MLPRPTIGQQKRERNAVDEATKAAWHEYYTFNFKYPQKKADLRSYILEEIRNLQQAQERLMGAHTLTPFEQRLALRDVEIYHQSVLGGVNRLAQLLRKPSERPPRFIYDQYVDYLPRISPDGHPVGTARDDTAEYQDFVNRIRSQMPDKPSAPAPRPPSTDGYQ